MRRKLRFASITIVALALLLPANSAIAQGVSTSSVPILLSQNIDEASTVALAGNTRREANAANDRGAVADNFQIEHMLLQLRRSPQQEQALQRYIDELQTKGSPNFHQWITAQEFGARFGLAKQDLDALTRWLESHSFKVNVVYPNGMVIDFSGTAGQVREAFKTEIHNLDVNGEKHIANMNDPRIPAAFAPAIAGIVSLHDFKPQTMHKMRRLQSNFTFNDSFGGTTYALVPADLATIYNLNPLFSAGYSGQGQTIVVIEDTDVFSTSDWSTFRSTLGLSSYSSGSFSRIYPGPSSGPNNCSSPGIIAPNDAEAILDAEWASAAAPSAAIQMAICADSGTTFGGLIALENLINASSQPPAIMSISYGQCETQNGASANAAYNSAYQQAASEGVSVFVAAGDSGASGCDNSASDATHGIGVNAFGSTPYNVAVGGTDFSDSYSGTNSNYWSSTNTSSFGSALSYIPEIPWNDSCAGELVSTYEGYSTPYGSSGFCNSTLGGYLYTTVAGGGGPSGCATGAPSVSGDVGGTCQGWPKPSWQSVVGNPNDGVRDTPDVSLFAADGLWSHYYIFCWSDTANGGAACSSDPSGWSGAGGTSFASPVMAGIQAVVNQKAGGRQGNPNPAYYQLAATEYGLHGNSSCNSSSGVAVSGSCIFYDVTQGDMDVNCVGNANCYLPSGTEGVLSTSDSLYNAAYSSTTGWDFATGIGSVNAANLVNNWPSSAPYYSLSASPGSLTITQGASGSSAITVNVQNGFNANVALSAAGLPSGVTVSFSPNPASTASTLTLMANSTATIGTATVTITGTSGNLTNTTTIALTVNSVGSFTLSGSPSSLSVAQGATGTSTITVTPQNGFNAGVTLSATGLPSGVTASFSSNPATTTSTLAFTASSTAATGTFPVTVTGTSGSLTNTAAITFTVTPGPNYALSASPGSLSITQGTSGASTITVTPQYGFSGSVSLSASGLPSGVTASFSPNPATATSTLTLTASSTATTGTVTATITGASGSLTKITTITVTVMAPPLETVWLQQDVGEVGQSGSATYANGTFTLKGSGEHIYFTADSGYLVYQPLSGDGTIVARVVTLQGGGQYQEAGVLIRETLDTASKNVYMAWGAGRPYLAWRSSTGGSTSSQTASNVALPSWVKLVRSGNTFTGYTSSDGVSWAAVSSQTVSMNTNAYVALATSAEDNNTALGTATLDNVSLSTSGALAPAISSVSTTTGSIGSQVVITGTGFGASQGSSVVLLNGALVTVNSWSATSVTITIPSGATSGALAVLVAPTMNASNPVVFTVTSNPLPAGWLDQDIGQVSQPGSATYVNGTFTLKGSGQFIYFTADSGYLVYQPLSGDGTIVARVVTLQGGGQYQEAGVLIRETLDTASKNVYMAWGAGRPYLAWRSSTGGSTSSQTASNVALPSWVKLVRSGNTFTGYTSSDGVSWAAVSSQTVSMNTNAYVALATSAEDNNTALGTATLDNVSLSTSGALAPAISSVSTTTGSIGSQVVITGTGFGASQGSSVVLLNGALVTVNSWSATSVTITIPSGATSGALAVLVAPSMNSSNPVSFTVVSGNYTLSGSPSSLSVAQGATGTSTITVTPQNGFNAGVTLSATGLPSGVTASFSSNPATTTSTLAFTASSTAATGTFPVTVTGTSGSLTNTAAITFTVTPGPNYALSASPGSLSITQGTSGASTITVTPQYGFSGSVSLSASGLPSGVTASFSPNPATATSTLTLTASSTATTGTVTATITGASGSLTNVATVTLNVTSQININLPSGWSDGDLGSVGQPGSASYANGTFTLKGSGEHIYFTADSGYLVYQPLSGDGTIVARVVTLQGGGQYQEAGVLIRETLDTASKNVYMAWGAGRPYLAWRSSTGGSTSSQTASNVALPSWVKLVRSGNTFTGYTSSDGVSWAAVSSQTVSMNTNAYVALATSAEDNNTALGTATLDNVSLSTSGALAPAISSVSTTTGSIGSQVVITGTGFGASQGSSVVLLNGALVTVNSWSATSVTITIPSGATSGALAVLVAPSMNSSNPLTFTVH